MVVRISKTILFIGLFIFMLNGLALAHNHQINIKAEACHKITKKTNINQARLNAIILAQELSIENLEQVKSVKENINDFEYIKLIKLISQNDIHDFSTITTIEKQDNICIEVSGVIKHSVLKRRLSPYKLQAEEELSAKKQYIDTELPNIYVAETKFFDGTKSDNLSDIVRAEIAKSTRLEVTNSIIKSDYILYPEIVKVKVEKVNKDMNRLNMIVSIKSSYKESGFKGADSENKFIAFEVSKDTNQVIFDLTKKLLIKNTKETLIKIENTIK